MNINNFLQSNKSINVIASAGTGKTWIIISKILRLLLDDIEPEKITAITFTKKAAAEMRERLNEKIEHWAQINEQDIVKELNEIGINKNLDKYCKKAKELFLKIQLNNKDIRISTFDSFFIEILLQFHLDDDISDNLTLNSKVNSNIISEEIQNKILSEEYLNNNISLKNNINFLIETIGSYNLVKNSIKEIINKKAYYLETNEKTDFNKSKIAYDQDILNNLQLCLIKDIRNMINENSLQKELEILTNGLNSKEISNEEKVNLIKNFFLTKSRTPKKSLTKKLEKNNIFIDIFIDNIFLYEEKVFREIQISWKFVIQKYFEEYQNFLYENDLYDFDDKTWLCYKKLSSLEMDDWILYKIANSINHLLIDEFQDTNSLQWKIIKIILLAIHNLQDKCTVTIVGDPNQSIYGFRGSEAKIFALSRDFTKKYFLSEDINLLESRRSSKEIIEYVNDVFNFQEKFTTIIKRKGKVIINNLKLETNDEVNSIEDQIYIESEKITEQIHNIVDNKTINYRDIIILLKDRTHIDQLADSMVANNIPFSTDKKKSLLENREINDIYKLLKYLILSEKNTHNLFSLITSPLFNVQIDEISKYDVNNFNDLEKFLIKNKFMNKIKIWKQLIGRIPIHDLLNKIYKDIDIYNKYISKNTLKNYEIKNNLLSFLNLSLKLNQGRYITPLGFLNYMEKIKKYPEDYQTILSNNVRILSIHAAKGLESEVVILAQTYRNNSKNLKNIIYPVFNNFLACEDLILRTTNFQNNSIIDKKFLDAKSKEETEEKNLLYVACTRAKNTLIINGFENQNCWFSNYLFF